ncbi:MAG: ribosome biogenesis GTPase Der [Gammaproteobacteria bacterium]|jgi:GTP-binding protein|uniref:GTPase Der n=1 Tax=SAR86 cluster bacterium TaxID=2030880 RepID=A0A368C8V5_9GAMM|nr:MAG: ribosome biogenesis GTPase Der [SAR86 cluster bacterium]
MFTSIAIIGRPNVGKSTLFNKLTKTRQAIVSDFPGLTKDRNYGYISLGSIKSFVIDTGGIGKDESNISQDISDQAWIAANECNLILFILDGSENLTSEDFNILVKLRKLNKTFITLLNKSDKLSKQGAINDIASKGINNFIEISAEHSRGIDELKKSLIKLLPEETEEREEQGKKIAVLGRPNAGKSTFINNFIKEDRLIVSEVAGTTIDAIRIPFSIDGNDFTFIDTAGIRKGYKQNHKVEYFSYVRAMHAVEESDVILFLVDSEESLVDQDLKLINIITEQGKPLLIGLNKVDLLTKSERSQIYDTKRLQSNFLQDFIKVEVSGKKGIGFKRLFRILNSIIKKSQTNYTTALLNKHLNKFIEKSAPPSVSGRQLKLRYVHFGGTKPTTLIIHSNQDKKIPKNYQKYLENSFREALGLKSIQLRIIFRKSDNPFDGKVNKLTERQIKKKKRLMKHVKK